MSVNEIHYVALEDVKLAYLEMGKGPLVLCLHGFPDTAYSFLPLMEKLAAAGFRVVAPFMRGYAPSSVSQKGDYSVLALAQDVLELIDALAEPGKQAVLIGHDWGGFAAYTAANLSAKRIYCLVQMSVPHLHISNFSIAQMRKSWYVWFFQLPVLPEKRLVENNFAFIDKLYAAWSPNWAHDDADLAHIKQSLAAEGGVKAALGYYRAMIRGVSMQQLRLMKQPTSVPTLLIAGEADGSIGIEQFDNMNTAYTGFFRYISYSRVGHFPHRENVNQLAADIREFIKQCR